MNKEILTDKLNNPHDYIIIDSLPSKSRCYPQLTKILVRDLMFDEIKGLGKFLSKTYDLKQVVLIYSDVIKLVNDNGSFMPLEDLELVDFHFLLVISSILTDDEAAWNISKNCFSCNKSFSKLIRMDELKYDVPESGPGGSVPIPNTSKSVVPMNIRSKMLLDNYEDLYNKYSNSFINMDEAEFQDLLSYAVTLDFKSQDELIENINLINTKPSISKNIKQVNKELTSTLMPVVLTCPHCQYQNRVVYDFDSIRGYL